jgi:hypothetical protein
MESLVLTFDQVQRCIRLRAGGVEWTDEQVDSAEAFARIVEREVLAALSPEVSSHKQGGAQPFNWPFDTSRGMSWNGFNVCGDEKSIAEVGRLVHYAPQWKAMLDEALKKQGDALQEARPGWRLVPVEPTFEMKLAASQSWKPARDGHYTARMEVGAEVWAAMLAATPPQAPHKDQQS